MKTTGLDRVKKNMAAVVEKATAPMDFLALYPCKVAAQNPDGTLELIPDNPKLPGFSSTPIRLGIPGVSVKVLPGSRVLLGFENGSPASQVAMLWEKSQVTEISVEPSISLLLGAGAVQSTINGTYFLPQLSLVLAAINTAVAALATALGAGPVSVALQAALTVYNTAAAAPPAFLTQIVKVK